MNKDRLLLLLDLEGIIGYSLRLSQEQNWDHAQRELDLLMGLLREQGLRELSVCVVHNDGTGFPEQILSRYGLRLFESAASLNDAVADVRCAFLIGFHGMRDTGGWFDHTFRMDFLDLEYDGQHLGEVGIFTRWLARRGIPTLLVSGEGNFRQELEGFDCVIHSVPPVLTAPDEIRRVSDNLSEAVLCALRQWDRAVPASHTGAGPLTVWVDNRDKYRLLAELPCLRAQEDRFVFPSIDVFIDNIYPFCLRLNDAMAQIERENRAFFQRVADSAPEEVLRGLLGDYLRRDFDTIDCADRRAIAEIVGLNYEGF